MNAAVCFLADLLGGIVGFVLFAYFALARFASGLPGGHTHPVIIPGMWAAFAFMLACPFLFWLVIPASMAGRTLWRWLRGRR